MGLTQRQITALLGERPADPQNAGPVLDDAAKTVTLGDLAVLWAGLQVVGPTWGLGALATLAFGLDLLGAFTAITVGTLAGGSLLALAHIMGRVGVPQMFLARYALGRRPATVIALVNFVSTMGWVAANAVLVAIAATRVLDAFGVARSAASELLVLGAITLPTLYLSVGSFDTVRRTMRWLVPPLLLALLPLSAFALAEVRWDVPATGRAVGGPFAYGTMWLTVAGVVAIGQVATWSTSAADIARFHRFDGPNAGRRVYLVVAGACLVVNVWLQMLGAAFATVAPGLDPAVEMARRHPLLALDALVLMVLGLITTNFINIISGSLSAKAVWRSGSRLAWTSAIAVVGTQMAAYSLLVTDVASVFHTFLVVLLVWETPWLGVMLTDYFLVRRGRYYRQDLYGLTGVIPSVNWRGLGAYLAGLATAAALSYTGDYQLFGVPLYSPLMQQMFNGADFSYPGGLVVSALVYLLVARRGVVPAAPAQRIQPPAGDEPQQRSSERARPLLTTAVTAAFLVAASSLFVALALLAGVLAPAGSGLAGVAQVGPPLLVGVLSLAGGLRLPRLVDYLVDRLDEQRLLEEAADTFSRTQSLPAVAAFLTQHTAFRLEFLRAWLVLPDAMRLAWPEVQQAPQPGRSEPLLDWCLGATSAVVLPEDTAFDRLAGVDVLLPWVAAGARVLVPLRSADPADDRLLGLWVVGAPRAGVALTPRRVRLLERIGQAATLHLDHARLAAEHAAALLQANEDLERRVAQRTLELERANEALEEARVIAEAASRVKGEFLTMMSHELRTPLNAVIGFSEGLRETAVEEGRGEYARRLEHIEAAGRHLLTLINSVLDLAKTEAGRTELVVEHFDLGGIVRDVVAAVTPLVEQRGNALHLDLALADGVAMSSDATKLRQVLLNLLSNAAKFTEHGVVRLTVEVLSDRAAFRVADTGIGMTPEQVARLFQPFMQAEAGTARRYGGTGLGLALSQRFCRLLGGEITVTSTAGAGSVFAFELPLSLPAAAGGEVEA